MEEKKEVSDFEQFANSQIQNSVQDNPPTFFKKPLPMWLKIYIAVIAIIVLSCLAGYIFLSKQDIGLSNLSVKTTPSPLDSRSTLVKHSPSPIKPVSITWKTYKNSEYNYSFSYPSTWSVDSLIANPTPLPSGGLCPISRVVVSSPEGYVFNYDNNQCLGDQPLALVKYKSVVVDGINLIKGYVNEKCSISVVDDSSNPNCKANEFTDIVYDTPESINNGSIGFVFQYQKRGIAISFHMPKPIGISDPNFNNIDKIIDTITSSIKLSN